MDKVQTIKKETEEILGKMIDSFEVEVLEEDGAYQVVIKTEEHAPTVIGRHGETIRAIQKILEVVLYKALGESVPLLVNVNDYREKQTQRLESFAAEMAQKAQSSKRPTQLRGLSSYERKVTHEYITTNYPELTTYSVGEGRERYLVIDMKGNEPEKNDNESNMEE